MNRHKRVCSYDMPDACDSADNVIDSLIETARHASSADERSKRIDELFMTVERYLTDPEISYVFQMYTEIDGIRELDLFRQPARQWIFNRVLRGEDAEEEEAMGICIFEGVGDEPIYDDEMDWLFSFLNVPAANWAVFSAFHTDERFPARLLEQYSRYVERCGSRGEEPARLDDAVLQEWIQEMRSPPE